MGAAGTAVVGAALLVDARGGVVGLAWLPLGGAGVGCSGVAGVVGVKVEVVMVGGVVGGVVGVGR